MAHAPRVAAAFTAAFALGGAAPDAAPDLIVQHAVVYTVDAARPRAEALSVRAGRIVAVGSNAAVGASAGPATTVVDARGATIVPGLIDAHMHLEGVGAAARILGVFDTATYDELLRRVAERVARPNASEWIIGRGWDQNRWPGQQFPEHARLDAVSAHHPIVLTRVDGHALLANAEAMRRAHITPATTDPPGGRIVRDSAGAPTGVFIDNAQDLVRRAVPPPTDDELRADIRAAVAQCIAAGITAVANPGIDRRTIGLEEDVARTGGFTIRDYIMVSGDDEDLAWAFARGPVNAEFNGHLWIRGIKLYADGALGSRGAALLAPYSDDPARSGLLVTDPARIEAIAEQGLRHGFQVATHAIGDRANRLVLDAYARAFAAVPAVDPRFRIEHAQVLAPADIPRFAALHVIASMQSSHQTSDMPWAEQRLGPERIKGAYAWGSLLRAGVHIANGTDAPVERINPLITFHSAVTRQDAMNQPAGGWYADQRMTREEALQSMTIWAAEANFQETVIGSLAPGKFADFVLLDRDVMTVPAEQILAARVVATYVDGKAVFRQ
ncbi:MAG: amidohydrolase [Candidatus Velthaea sp.]